MPPADLCPHASLERMNRFQEPEARRIIGGTSLPLVPAGRWRVRRDLRLS
jgi:hypothetical protein